MPFDFRSLSLFKIIALVLVVLCIVMIFLPWVTVKVSAFGVSESESVNVFKTGIEGECTSFWSVVLIIFAILAFLAILLAVFGILTDRSLLALPLAALAVLMFLFAIFQSLYVKSVLKSAMGDYGSYLSGFLKIHAGVGAWLFLVFGLGAFGLLFYEDRIQGRNTFDSAGIDLSGVSMPKVNLPGVGGWNCPSCGAKNGAGQNFCTTCGTKKPEPPRCPNCGKLLKAGEAFCSNCGTRV